MLRTNQFSALRGALANGRSSTVMSLPSSALNNS